MDLTRAVSRLVLGAALALLAPLPAAADANWWSAAWTARRTLTFNNGAQATNLVGFPVLVRLDSGRIDYAKVQDSGQDLRFVDADNLTVLPHEIESWDEGGSSYVWVRVPQVNAASTTDFIYMYYGNPGGADGQNAAGVWDTDFKMVQHLRETGGQHLDSTSNNNDSVSVNVSAQGTATGRVNGADTFAGAHNVDVADAATLDAAAGESLTVEAWVRSSSASNFMVAVSKEEDNIAEYQLWVQNGTAAFWTNYDPDDVGPLEYPARVNSAVNVRNGSWHYLVGRWNGATRTADLYVNGAAAGTPVTNALMNDLASANPLVIGEEGDANRGGNFDGDLDEVRISKVLRSPDWIRAQNLSMTDAFITFGGEPLHTFTDVTARCGLSLTRSPLDKVSQRKVVRDRNGFKYLVFGRFRDTGGCVGYQEVKLARSTDGGATWTEVTLFGLGGLAWNTATESFIYPAIDANAAADELHVVVQQASGVRLLYAKNTSLASWDQASAWTRANGTRGANNPPTEFEGAEQPHSRSILSNTAPAIAVDGDGLPHVSFQAVNGSDRNVYWQFWQPGGGTWSGEVQVSETQSCTSSARDVSIDFGEGKDGTGTTKARVHFLYMKDANCAFGVDTLCYAFAEKTGSETFALTQKPCTGSGLPPYSYLFMTNGTGAGRVTKGASVVAHGGEVWAVAGYDNGGGATVESAYSDTNGDLWPLGAAGGAQMHSSASPTFSEGYPSVGADLAGHKHRILSAESLGASTTRLYGYQWRPRKLFSTDTSIFRFRSLLALDNAAGETTDYAHVTLEKEKRGADFASCWYVSEEDATPPPGTPLLVDEIRCSVEPSVMYRSISLGAKAAYSTGTVAATSGGKSVTGTGTAWKSNGWATGDRLNLEGANYIVAAVVSDAALSITTPFQGQTGGAKPYSLARQFTSLQTWENCLSGNVAQCPAFPSTTGSLVSDNRIEVGLVYDDGSPGSGVTIDGSTTDIAHTITLQAAPGHRHLGDPLAGAYLQPVISPTILVKDLNVRVEWLVLRGGNGGVTEGSVQVDVTDSGWNGPIEIANNIMVNLGKSGIVIGPTESQNVVVDASNNVIAPNNPAYQAIRLAPFGSTFNPGSDVYAVNNTAYGTAANGITSLAAANAAVTLLNNVAWGFATCFNVAAPAAESNYNLSSDASAPGPSSLLNVPATGGGGVNFTDPGVSPGTHNYHLLATSVAIEAGGNLASLFQRDMDSQKRPGGSTWDIGADEFGAPTAVGLMSFVAVPGDGQVTLEWRTGSEIDNVGFHVWRGRSTEGPWTRITTAIIPGAGTSVLGHAYSWLDAGLANGVEYFYRLEDVDTSSVSRFHGPVSAVPGGAAAPPEGGGGGSGGGSGGTTSSTCPAWVLAAYGSPVPAGSSCTRHGDPDAVSYDVVSRDARGATLELRTGGFWALRFPAAAGETSGTVRVLVSGFDTPSDPKAPALPLRRALVDAVVGKKVRLVSAEPLDLFGFPGLRPSAVGQPEAAISRDGTVRPARRARPAPRLSRGYLPQFVARLAPSVFQGETKSAVVEIFPVRFDGYRQQLVLARRVRVRLAFSEREPAETGTGSTGRVLPQPTAFREVLAQLHTTRRGLHAVAFEDLFPARQRGLPTSVLRLQRQGQPVAFRVEPPSATLGPGSVFYFFADRVASSTDFSGEVAWELVRGTGQPLGVVLANPDGSPSVSSQAIASFEANKFYMPDLLEAPDPWLWQAAIASPGSPVTTAPLTFTLSGVDAASPLGGRLVVNLQGGSESGYATDHHLEVRLNGSPVGEALFSGGKPYRFDAAVSVASLLEGANTLTLTNLADTGVTSRVFLDRFSVSYPQLPSLRAGVLEGTWAEPGIAEVAGQGTIVLDTTLAAGADVTGTSPVKWLLGVESTGSSVRFRAEAGHRYFIAAREGLLFPRVARPAPSALPDAQNQADFILVAPRDFLDAAQPLLDRRGSQGLTTAAVAFEEITETFGHGQPSPEAIRDFLSFAFHSWSRPSPRYVLLLGDATFDPRRFQAASWASPLPALWAKTSYLTTASDPALASVNGQDLLPDFAIGRLPAQTPAEAETLVQKILAWEDSGQSFDGNAVLVADNPDEAGDFEADVEDIRARFLATRPTQVLKLRELGSSMRPAVKDAFDQGASLMSYVGHGGAALWASENVWNSWDVPSLLAQSRQPLLLTLNCLNGYFVANNHDALAEALLKAPGRGAIAAVSPSGLSLDGPAHLYHRALVAEVTSGQHQRLGDALLAAQKAYAQTGFMPELLAIYHLIGDPATRIR